MPSILIISFSDLKRDPRVHRQIESLRGDHRLVVAGLGDPDLPGVRFVRCTHRPLTLPKKIYAGISLLLRRYDSYYWRQSHVAELEKELDGLPVDLVIANDIESLPLALKFAGERPVILDAHEYSPLEFEDKWVHRAFFSHYKDAMCRRLMEKAAAVTTIGQGIADRYEQEYGVRVEVITNAACFHDFSVRPTQESHIRLIHHGAAIASRRLELMIELMDHLDERFSLDFVLMPATPGYLERIKRLASGKPNIRFLEAVPMEQLVTLSSHYDVGLFLLPPTNFNYKMALPNKFFEFIQARLAIAVGPSPEMAKIIKEFDCGAVAPDFSPLSMARELNRLTARNIDRMKTGSDRAAQVHNGEYNAEKLRGIVASVLRTI